MLKFCRGKFFYRFIQAKAKREYMRVENYNIETAGNPKKKKNSSVKRKEKDGVVTTTTVTKENGVKTEVTETVYPDGRIVTQTKSSGCGVHNIGVINLGSFNLESGEVEANSIFTVKDENGDFLIGEELEANLDKNGVINVNDIIDSEGNVKPDYKIFDLNGDGRLADNEFDWFANGGASSFNKSASSVSAGNFENSVNTLDTIRAGSKSDGIITTAERKALHSMLDAPEKFY